MKKTLMIAALSGVFATAAHAQSSVTLYGLIDAGVTYINNVGNSPNGHAVWQESSGSINGSRWGLRGSEDLGGGLKAIFTLENGFNIANGTAGQNSRMFGRQAFVGLASDQSGSVTLGRQYDSVVDYLAPLSLATDTSFAHPYDNDNLNNSFRINNSVKFKSANYDGFQFGALYGFSNSPGFSSNRVYSVGATYAWGGLKVAGGYLQLNNDLNSANLANSATSSGAVAGDYKFLASRQRTFGGGVNYAFGPATVGFVYSQTNLENLEGINISGANYTGTLTGANGGGRFQNFEGNLRYALTPAFGLSGMYTYTRASLGGVNPNYNSVNLQADYTLSPRTDLYVQGSWQHVSSNGVFAPEINGYGSAQYSGPNGPTQNQVAVTAGIRHRF